MIKLICVGSIKENYLKDAIDDYLTRIKKFTKIELIEVKDSKIEEKALLDEEKEILKHIKDKDYVITLEIDGNMKDSISFSNYLEKLEVEYNNIVFIIGGSLGLSDKIKELSNYKLSFSKMTFPHQLFRLILLEQIYRAYKIKNNETYHK